MTGLSLGLESVVQSVTHKLSSDMRTEVAHLSSKMRQEMQALATEVDRRRELLRTESETFADNKQLASSKDWVIVTQNSRYCCGFCTTHSTLFKHPSQRSSPWILGNGGVRYNRRLTNQLWQHEQSDMHMLSVECESSRARNPLEFSIQHQLLESRLITEKLFRITYDNALHYRSFLEFENLVRQSQMSVSLCLVSQRLPAHIHLTMIHAALILA
jgi:hypothetical protein